MKKSKSSLLSQFPTLILLPPRLREHTGKEEKRMWKYRSKEKYVVQGLLDMVTSTKPETHSKCVHQHKAYTPESESKFLLI